jgi:CRISPR-associated protein Cas1
MTTPSAWNTTSATASLNQWQTIESPSHAAAAEHSPRFLHVVEQGALIRKAGLRLQVTKKDKLLLDVPTIKLQGVVLYGNPQVSTQCLRMLLEQGVWLSFFTRQGSYKGRLQPPSELGVALRREQWKRSEDPAFCVAFARTMIRAKLLGAREVAAAYSQNYLAESLGEGHLTIRQCLEKTGGATLEELLGIEGLAARAYWGLFRRWNRSALGFPGRVKRGATDPVNILLNFAYTLLTRELEGLLESAGLDASCGLFHTPEPGRPALACDWVEEFRHTIVDRLVLTLINRKQIQEKDFDLRDQKQGARLGPAGLRTFIQAYEQAMIGRQSAGGGEAEEPGRGYRTLLIDQLGRLLDSLKPGGAPYCPHVFGDAVQQAGE